MDIIARVLELRHREHLCTVDLLEALLECDRTRAYLEHGYESLWTFLVGALRYSNAAASRRSQALKCARKFPVVITWLREERVTLSSLEAIAPVLGKFDSAQALLDRIDGKSQTEVQKIVARERPVPEQKEQVKWVFVVPEVPEPTALFEGESEEAAHEAEPVAARAPAPAPVPAPPPQPQERVRVTLSLSPEEFALIERARAIASRRPGRVPSVHEVLVESVKTYLERKAPKVRTQKRSAERDEPSGNEPSGNEASSNEPSSNQPSSNQPSSNQQTSNDPIANPTPRRHSRHIPAAIRDAVLLRDGERCTFVSADGHRCEATHRLHVDHIRPHAFGGSNTLDNLRVLCSAHNRRRAAVTFGEYRGGTTASTSS